MPNEVITRVETMARNDPVGLDFRDRNKSINPYWTVSIILTMISASPVKYTMMNDQK